MVLYHEATHAVVGAAVGARVHALEINPQLLTPDWGSTRKCGHVDLSGISSLHPQSALLILLAAEAAEARVLRDMGYLEHTHPGLRERCRVEAAESHRPAIEGLRRTYPRADFDLRAAWADAERLVTDPALWEAFGEVGDAALERAGTGARLGGAEIQRILAPYELRAWLTPERDVIVSGGRTGQQATAHVGAPAPSPAPRGHAAAPRPGWGTGAPVPTQHGRPLTGLPRRHPATTPTRPAGCTV
ncbi:hypothetical protein DEF23_21340 [Marinitenerispora sediminis]|uniref:Peptidase M41 domain-containing protein n=2 Tax=Marinitenerispora sediminis TaxID=1931232 RepID=A0A368T5B9_9ACTN|nr:hypothetical protein DEF28_22635 [Marinitenerispora sediminis]RCV50892.1 hypothetical protein DEF23_21340 [Marinitenerispora sediminis]RCV58670.1 hypothetical protein DEF24_12590 [Marinitenerispora sediminis]